MNEFTQFELETPIVIPAVPEKTFNKQWLTLFQVISENPTKKTRLVATFKPTNGQEVIEQGKETLVIDDIFTMMTDTSLPVEIRTGIAQAMEGVFQALKAYKAYKAQ